MCGNFGTYEDVVPMPLSGRVRDIDRCIARIVAALDAGGVTTVASCCGHGQIPGSVMLEDGRYVAVLTKEQYEQVNKLYVRAREGGR